MPVSDQQEKGDVIYRQDAVRVLGAQCKDKYNKTCGEHCECMEYMALRDMPSAQKKGHWIDKEICFTCSECVHDSIEGGNFCPNCGADMRKEGEENG